MEARKWMKPLQYLCQAWSEAVRLIPETWAEDLEHVDKLVLRVEFAIGVFKLSYFGTVSHFENRWEDKAKQKYYCLEGNFSVHWFEQTLERGIIITILIINILHCICLSMFYVNVLTVHLSERGKVHHLLLWLTPLFCSYINCRTISCETNYAT